MESALLECSHTTNTSDTITLEPTHLHTTMTSDTRMEHWVGVTTMGVAHHGQLPLSYDTLENYSHGGKQYFENSDIDRAVGMRMRYHRKF